MQTGCRHWSSAWRIALIELEESNSTLQQRTEELTIINRVQEGLVKQLDFQAIIDLVGDEIRRIFPSPAQYFEMYSVYIALLDENQMIHFPYWCSGNGERFSAEPMELGEGLTSKVLLSRQSLRVDTWKDAIDLRPTVVDDGLPEDEHPESYLGVPIMIGDRATGVIAVQDPRKVRLSFGTGYELAEYASF
jgi:GAF domain-containing protein